jgi:hypothetical protein
MKRVFVIKYKYYKFELIYYYIYVYKMADMLNNYLLFSNSFNRSLSDPVGVWTSDSELERSLYCEFLSVSESEMMIGIGVLEAPLTVRDLLLCKTGKESGPV